jgi:Na+/H+ antiporter NhaD/arsenite permease-like protein
VKRGDRNRNARVIITMVLVAWVVAAVFAAPLAASDPAAPDTTAGGHREAAAAVHGQAAAETHGGGHGAEQAPHVPPYWMVVFFVLMLLTIAVLPLTPLNHWWENNARRFMVAVILGAYPAIYYIRHDFNSVSHVMLYEYVPFIVLLGSLFMIAGGIRLTGDLRATPATNTAFIAIGTLLASAIGTTGASMLLIRPVLQTNRERQHKVHTVIFFIFLVSNIGGSLLPIGDPPLFLGYLAGVPFFWTLNLWHIWLPTAGVILLVYYLLDRRYYAKESPSIKAWDREAVVPLRLEGALNFLWLFGVVASVIWVHEHCPVPFLRKPFLREVIMLVMVGLAFATSPLRNWKENHFTMGPITEVAALFFGIFLTMTPALAILKAKGGELGVDTPLKFFWGTGTLSSFLDNAPTYMVFFKTASGAVASGAVGGANLIGTGIDRVPSEILVAISVGAVFMGANTYIGNGPNFMVKAIAEESGIRMPSFFGYMRWSMLVLIPVFLLVTLLFFR